MGIILGRNLLNIGQRTSAMTLGQHPFVRKQAHPEIHVNHPDHSLSKVEPSVVLTLTLRGLHTKHAVTKLRFAGYVPKSLNLRECGIDRGCSGV